MGERERVFLVDDNIQWFSRTKQLLESAGHSVVASALGFVDAFVETDNAIKCGATVAIVDGRLDSFSSKTECTSGEKVAVYIKSKHPHITIVAFSEAPKEKASYGDYYVCKADPSVFEVLKETIFTISRPPKP